MVISTADAKHNERAREMIWQLDGGGSRYKVNKGLINRAKWQITLRYCHYLKGVYYTLKGKEKYLGTGWKVISQHQRSASKISRPEQAEWGAVRGRNRQARLTLEKPCRGWRGGLKSTAHTTLAEDPSSVDSNRVGSCKFSSRHAWLLWHLHLNAHIHVCAWF